MAATGKNPHLFPFGTGGALFYRATYIYKQKRANKARKSLKRNVQLLADPGAGDAANEVEL
jgi:hypothetical protein